MKAYTYHSHVEPLADPDLLKLWEASWRRNGWEPVVLNERDAAAADPAMFERFKRSPLLLSCPGNPKAYTLAAMLRWVAMTAIDEPCVHTDWDVLSHGFRPEHVPATAFPAVYFGGSTCPCAMYGDGRAWKLIAAALECVPFTPEFKAEDLLKDSCDQYALSIQPKSWSTIHQPTLCKIYNDEVGWEVAPMIHFPNRTTARPRSKTIMGLGFSL